MYGMFDPMCHKREFTADFLEEPVPTTSPTNTNCVLSFFKASSSASGFFIFSENFKKACACSGISGLDHASFAGEKSSVFVSPLTLKTLRFICFGILALFSNHFASDHESTTAWAN